MRLLFIFLFLFIAGKGIAQDSLPARGERWDLRRSVDYAMKNNISVRQADVQAKIVALTHEQSRLSQYPSVNIQNRAGYQFGRSIDPASNEFINAEILFIDHGLSVGLDVFNWFSKKNTIAANRLYAMAYSAGVEKAKNDIALNVANAYLQILLNKEQVRVSEAQLELSREQVFNIRKRVDAGGLPELNLAQAEAQLAEDSSLLITASSNHVLSLLLLKSILNLPADMEMDIVVPPVEMIPVESLADLDPAAVYALAEVNMPQQQINDLNLQASIKNVAAAKGRMYPSLTLFGGLDTRYSNAQRFFGTDYVNAVVPIGTVNVGGTPYTVTTIDQQFIPTNFSKNTYFRQLNNNFGQSVGIVLNIPVFNGGAARINWQKAKLDVRSAELQKEGDAQVLKQDIYTAHANAVAAMQKYNASQKTVDAATKAYDFARKRFEIGLLNTLDLITTQNTLFRARINMVSARYDYVFKMKLLEFYKGQGLKL